MALGQRCTNTYVEPPPIPGKPPEKLAGRLPVGRVPLKLKIEERLAESEVEVNASVDDVTLTDEAEVVVDVSDVIGKVVDFPVEVVEELGFTDNVVEVVDLCEVVDEVFLVVLLIGEDY